MYHLCWMHVQLREKVRTLCANALDAGHHGAQGPPRHSNGCTREGAPKRGTAEWGRWPERLRRLSASGPGRPLTWGSAPHPPPRAASRRRSTRSASGESEQPAESEPFAWLTPYASLQAPTGFATLGLAVLGFGGNSQAEAPLPDKRARPLKIQPPREPCPHCRLVAEHVSPARAGPE